MIIKFFPFIQAMIEQEEVITIENNKLNFRRVFGADRVEQTFILDNEVMNKVKKVVVQETELIEMQDVILVNDIPFNFINSTDSYKDLCNSLSKLKFKYNPRALNVNCLFYLGDFKKHFIHHFYEDAINFINENNLELIDNTVIINNDKIEINLEDYKVISFNTDNTLYQVVISTLVFNRYNF